MATPPRPSTLPPTPAENIPTGSSSLGRDEFLQLLVAQLRHQDPTSPQQGHEFVAQLAQFSSVEQLATISTTLDAHSSQLAALAEGLSASSAQQAELAVLLKDGMNLSTASALVGQTVEVEGNAVAWDGHKPVSFGFDLDGGAEDVRVEVRGADGAVVRTLSLGAQGGGTHTVTWDGLGDDGAPLAPGSYTFSVAATDAAERPVDATGFVRLRIDRITIEDSGVLLWFGDHSVPLSRLRSVVS